MASSCVSYPAAVSDALLLVIVLCKIAAKEVEGGASAAADVYKAHSKVLALDLLRQLLEGPSAGTWLARLHAPLRRPLGVALLRAAGGLGGAPRLPGAAPLARARGPSPPPRPPPAASVASGSMDA